MLMSWLMLCAAVMQKAMFQALKGGLLHDKRRSFGAQNMAFCNALDINMLHMRIFPASLEAQTGVRIPHRDAGARWPRA